ncbi:hypothetical protein ANN_20006 [Periplaneta americana]|uniref:Uncharacterized protein n=1 Tax=Periplaneta americana TaxID=6978 RepID=A0ABQ8SBF9_PERAM|nr:hypothetical protein ANN_20006 [Periplaneta americana]
MAGVCEGGNEPPGSLKASKKVRRDGRIQLRLRLLALRPVPQTSARQILMDGSSCQRPHSHNDSPVTTRRSRNLIFYNDEVRSEDSPLHNGWGDHRANHTIQPFWLDDRPPLFRHVDVRPAVGWSVLALHGL